MVIGGLVIGLLVIGDWWNGGMVEWWDGVGVFRNLCQLPGAPQGKRMKIRK